MCQAGRVEMGHAGADGGDGAQRGFAGLSRRSGDREDRQDAIADEFQHLAAEGVHGAGDAVEPGVEGGNHHRRLGRFGKGGEIPEVGAEEGCADGLAGAAAQRAVLHPGGTSSSEIGFEQGR